MTASLHIVRDATAALEELRAAIVTTPVEHLPAIIGAVEAIKAEAFARLVAPSHPPAASGDDDQLLNVEETAALLGESVRWVRDHQDDLPRVDLGGRGLRFSKRRLVAKIQRASYRGGRNEG